MKPIVDTAYKKYEMNFTRRNFLELAPGALLAACGLPRSVFAMREALPPLKLKEITINAGATKPFSAIQISDTHLAMADKRDDERKIKLAAHRDFSKWGAYYLDQAVTLARANGDLLLHTGDLIDFVSAANLEQAEGRFAGNDWFVSAGNHEFSQYVGEAREDESYKAQSAARVRNSYPNDLVFASRVVNGVNLVAIDDVYYNVTDAQRELFEKEVAKDLPIVLLCHVPFYGPELYAREMARTNNRCAYVCGAPEELTRTYDCGETYPAGQEWRYRKNQQRADKPTADFIAYLKSQPLLKGILCGHVHSFFEERFSPTAMQFVCSATYKGEAQRITFV